MYGQGEVQQSAAATARGKASETKLDEQRDLLAQSALAAPHGVPWRGGERRDLRDGPKLAGRHSHRPKGIHQARHPNRLRHRARIRLRREVALPPQTGLKSSPEVLHETVPHAAHLVLGTLLHRQQQANTHHFLLFLSHAHSQSLISFHSTQQTPDPFSSQLSTL